MNGMYRHPLVWLLTGCLLAATAVTAAEPKTRMVLQITVDYAHANTETAPGHATLATGSHPSRHGIVANSGWGPDVRLRGSENCSQTDSFCDSPT